MSSSKVKVRVGDREFEAEVSRVGPSRYRVVIEGREIVVEIPSAERAVPTVVTSAAPTPMPRPTTSAPSPTVAKPSPPPAVGGGNEIRAPISGKVLKVLVKPGDSVEPKTVVVTLESMKMELEVYAGRSGRIKEVLVKPGDTVQTGQVIAVLE